MSFRDDYNRYLYLAYQKNWKAIEKKRAYKLYFACHQVNGHKWADKNFIIFLLRITRNESLYPCKIYASCVNHCKYKISRDQTLQKNALRIESLILDIYCGVALKPGHIGGEPLDYFPCINGSGN